MPGYRPGAALDAAEKQKAAAAGASSGEFQPEPCRLGRQVGRIAFGGADGGAGTRRRWMGDCGRRVAMQRRSMKMGRRWRKNGESPRESAVARRRALGWALWNSFHVNVLLVTRHVACTYTSSL
jgi:hypothetical protein